MENKGVMKEGREGRKGRVVREAWVRSKRGKEREGNEIKA